MCVSLSALVWRPAAAPNSQESLGCVNLHFRDVGALSSWVAALGASAQGTSRVVMPCAPNPIILQGLVSRSRGAASCNACLVSRQHTSHVKQPRRIMQDRTEVHAVYSKFTDHALSQSSIFEVPANLRALLACAA